jgi:hypothetical protein
MIQDSNVGKFAGILPRDTAHIQGAEVSLRKVPDGEERMNEITQARG